MEPDEMKRQAIRMRGGVGGEPTERWIDTHNGQPEFVTVGDTTPDHHYTVYIPTLPPLRITEPTLTELTPQTVMLSARDWITRVRMVERTEVDVSDPLHPVINIYGYERIYRARVWMTDDEQRAIDR